MTLGSLFDGSGTCCLAGEMTGIEPKWLAEIDPFCCKVTANRFPGVPNLGDVKKIDGSSIEPVDVITFGSPCTSLSLAGSRKGLAEDAPSSIFFEAIRIIREMRNATNGKYPRFAMWENVRGSLSTNHGEDFRTVLESFLEAPVPKPDKWHSTGCIMAAGRSVAWRVLDAQYWGVAQRRARIYLVCDFGGSRAGEILFKQEGLPGDFDACRAPWQEHTRTTADGNRNEGTGVTRKWLVDNHSNDSRYTLRSGNEPCQTLVSRMGTGGNNQPFVLEEVMTYTQGRYTDPPQEDSLAMTLKSTDHKRIAVGAMVLTPQYRVRRITPFECQRLQGFPDDYLDGVDGSDTAKYKMWGNGMALPCVLYVMNGIRKGGYA